MLDGYIEFLAKVDDKPTVTLHSSKKEKVAYLKNVVLELENSEFVSSEQAREAL